MAETTARLHVAADGHVWYGDGSSPAVDTGLDPWAFAESAAYLDRLEAVQVVRLLGTAGNASLVVKLHERRAVDPTFRDKPVYLASPAGVPAAWLRADPGAVLHHLLQPPPSARGCHLLSPADYPTYAMIDTLAGSRGVPEVTRRIAAHHPAWPVFTFLRGADLDAACRLLCDVVDPRWFHHPARPTRLTRLYAHLGLTPQNAAAVAGEGASPGRHFNRAATAVRVWYNSGLRRPAAEPADFPGAVLAGPGPLGRRLLAGTRRLVALVAWVWADGASRTRHADGGFDPAVFFRDQATSAAFARHLAAARR